MIITGILIFGCGQGRAEWENSSAGIKENYANIVVVDAQDNNTIYAATGYFLYKSKDNGKSWQEVFAMPGKENIINFVAVGHDAVYVATGDGLYASLSGAAGAWQKVYYGSNPAENAVNCVALDKKNPDLIYVATDNGVFVSKDKAKTWKTISTGLGTLSVKYIVIEPDSKAIYIAGAERIFKSSDNGSTWKNVYTMVKADTAEAGEESAEDSEETFGKISCLFISPKNPAEIYAATSKGVLVSKNGGNEWAFMTNLGLDPGGVKYITISSDTGNIYAGAYKGVFLFDKGQTRWVELYKGSTFRDARFLSIDDRAGVIWAAATNGVFKAAQAGIFASVRDMELPEGIRNRFAGEPTIAEVQRAAIRYAEVHPNKIKNWRNEARMRALLPDVDLSYDKNVSVSTSTNSFTVGPKDWGVGFSWDVGDLVFSDDQTNIDVRSRLMDKTGYLGVPIWSLR
jgi:photosystem II stability/assembly factor-like uncharacterized protein